MGLWAGAAPENFFRSILPCHSFESDSVGLEFCRARCGRARSFGPPAIDIFYFPPSKNNISALLFFASLIVELRKRILHTGEIVECSHQSDTREGTEQQCKCPAPTLSPSPDWSGGTTSQVSMRDMLARSCLKAVLAWVRTCGTVARADQSDFGSVPRTGFLPKKRNKYIHTLVTRFCFKITFVAPLYHVFQSQNDASEERILLKKKKTTLFRFLLRPDSHIHAQFFLLFLCFLRGSRVGEKIDSAGGVVGVLEISFQ